MTGDLTTSNSLPDLAARIKHWHNAVADALNDSVRHGIAAGELLIEAKARVPHGQWLFWLQDHVQISERTAQLYMRLAKNRAEIEANTQCVADLTLNEAAALLTLSSDLRKLYRFIKDVENEHDPNKITEAVIAAGFPVIHDPSYDPFAGRSDEEKREWYVFILFLAHDGYHPEGACQHVEWVLQRPFQNVAEWLGNEGDKFRKRWRMNPVSDAVKGLYQAFAIEHAGRSVGDISAELEKLKKEFEQRRAVDQSRRGRKSRKAPSLQRAAP